MINAEQIEEANRLFAAANFNDQQTSRLEMSSNQKRNMGVIMFVVGFWDSPFSLHQAVSFTLSKWMRAKMKKPIIRC